MDPHSGPDVQSQGLGFRGLGFRVQDLRSTSSIPHESNKPQQGTALAMLPGKFSLNSSGSLRLQTPNPI